MEQTSQNLKTLHGRVEYILSNYPKTRNSDLELQAELAYNFYPKIIEIVTDWRDIVRLMKDVPSLDHIARVRRKVIEGHNYTKYLPTNPAVAKARKINEEVWKQYAWSKPPQVVGNNIPIEHQRAYERDEL